MIIELSYGQVFWIGVSVGVLLCFFVRKVINYMKGLELGEDYARSIDLPNYLEPTPFEYKPVDYLKYLHEPRLHNQGQMPNRPDTPMPPLKKPKKSPPLPEDNPNK